MYNVTPPEKAPPLALELLGNPEGKSLDELREFVCSLHPQVAFKKRMLEASAEELIEYMTRNGYGVEEV